MQSRRSLLYLAPNFLNKMKKLSVFRTRTILVALLLVSQSTAHYMNQWAIDVIGGSNEDAAKIAKDTGCENKGVIIENTYLFECHHVAKRSAEPHSSLHAELTSHHLVTSADQQKILSRKKRQLNFFGQMSRGMGMRMPQQQQVQQASTNFIDLMHLNDDRWPQMWYLNRGGRLDMNVQEAWTQGVTGKGISVTILDDGIERTHPDLQANYDPLASFDVNQNDNDPTPRYDLIDSNRHGTRCAGEVAATANNSNCAVGIAYEAGIGGVRMLDGDVTDAVEARSIGLNNQHIDIYSASWGPDDDGKTVDGPGRLATRAFLQGITKGRGGKGSIFVWASGNGGRDYDNCNCDGYTNSPWTLSVSSATENGLIPWYSEACSSTMATTYSSGSSGERKVVTTDLHHTCTSTHTGTSASAPLAAGIIALVLHANPNLNWRDVQHITVRCAHNANLRATDWSHNAAGRNFSHSFGYGIMDASCMVGHAKQWTTVPEQKKCSRSGGKVDKMINARSKGQSTITVDNCDGLKYIEHIQAHVTLGAAKRGDVQIFLISPQGTRTNLIAKRPKDYSRAGFNDWPFLTVHMWEESPIGTWTLEIVNDGRSLVELRDWSLVFLGTETHPQPSLIAAQPNAELTTNTINIPQSQQSTSLNQVKPNTIVAKNTPNIPSQPIADVTKQNGESANRLQAQKALLENCLESSLNPTLCKTCNPNFFMFDGQCQHNCPEKGYYKGMTNHQKACLPCYYSCKTCSGPNDYQCSSCYDDAVLEEESHAQSYCHNKSLIDKMIHSSRWYYVLSIGFLVNFCIIVVLVSYIVRWKRNRRNIVSTAQYKSTLDGPVNNSKRAAVHLTNSNNNSFSTYAPVKSMHSTSNGKSVNGKTAISMPYYDNDSSSEDDQLFRKPYTDEVK